GRRGRADARGSRPWSLGSSATAATGAVDRFVARRPPARALRSPPMVAGVAPGGWRPARARDAVRGPGPGLVCARRAATPGCRGAGRRDRTMGDHLAASRDARAALRPGADVVLHVRPPDGGTAARGGDSRRGTVPDGRDGGPGVGARAALA